MLLMMLHNRVPNVCFESLALDKRAIILHFILLTHSDNAAGVFLVAGALQMTQWALGKQKRYRSEFPNYPRRKSIIPFII